MPDYVTHPVYFTVVHSDHFFWAERESQVGSIYCVLCCYVCFGLHGTNDVYSAVMRTGAVEGGKGEEGKGKLEGAALGDFGG